MVAVIRRRTAVTTVAGLDERFATDDGLALPGRALLATGRA
jgi:hypothetical protein